MFLRELCDALGLQPPDPAGDPETNDYVFERVVKEPGRDGTVSSRRIDLYKRGSFVLEAKQSRQQKGGDKEVQGHADLFVTEMPSRGRRGADRAWDVLMLNARRQAEDYVRLLLDPFPFPAANHLQEQRVRVIAEDLDAHRKRVLTANPHITLTGLYNVLEKLRAGTTPDALEPANRRIFDEGLVLILKELHDRLDAAVADAYAWPADLGDEDILARLVALNMDRAKEEARGQVRWLRPEHQIPRFGSAKEKAELDLVGGGMAIEGVAGPKPSFPAEDVAQTAAVMSALAVASGPMDAPAVASTFKQGRRVAPKVGAVLNALARMGFAASSDGGRTFQLRRVA